MNKLTFVIFLLGLIAIECSDIETKNQIQPLQFDIITFLKCIGGYKDLISTFVDFIYAIHDYDFDQAFLLMLKLGKEGVPALAKCLKA